jgi:hypothetical protein
MNFFLRIWIALLSVSLTSALQAEERFEIRVFQRVTSSQKQTLLRFASGQHDTREVQETRSSLQVAATLLVASDKTLANGATHWRATISALAFSPADEALSLPADWPVESRRRAQLRRELAKKAAQTIVGALRGARFGFVRQSDGRVSWVDVAALQSRSEPLLRAQSREGRDPAQRLVAPLLSPEFWRLLLEAQAPIPPAEFLIGAKQAYSSRSFFWPFERAEGTSTVVSLPVVANSTSAQVVSSARKKFTPRAPARLQANSTSQDIKGDLLVSARTVFNAHLSWPVEHSALERAQGNWQTWIVDKNKRARLIDNLPFTFQVQSHLVSKPLL